jgi:hypothetical protein
MYGIVKSGIESLESTVKAIPQAIDDCKEISGSLSVRNPSAVNV